MSFFLFYAATNLRQRFFVLLQIVLQKTEIMNQGKTVFAQIMAHTKKLILQVHKDHKKAIV